MARRATYIRETREQADIPVLVVDSGNTLLGTPLSIDTEGEPIVEAMNAIGYDALGIGALDLMLGLDTLLARREQASFPFVSANLLQADGTLLLEPYTIVEKGSLKIAIIGITEPYEELVARAPEMLDVVKTSDAVQAAKQYADRVRDEVDVIVVLSRLGLERDKSLAEAVPEVDVIIGGNSRTLLDEPVRVGNTVISQQGYQGEWIGRTEVSWNARGIVTQASTAYITLDPEIADDPALLDLIRRWNALYATPVPTE